MKTWSEAIQDGAVSGSVASVLSTAVLGTAGKLENDTPFAPTNAISHWFWGDRAARQDAPSLRYTGLGYAIHHLSGTLWATLYEKWFGDKAERHDIVPALAGPAAVAGPARLIDYKLTPQRLQPGFEKRLSTPALIAVYATFGAALALRGLAASQRRGHGGRSGYTRAFPLYQ